MKLLPKLQTIQESYGYLPMEQLSALAAELDLSLTEIISTASFYAFFTFEKDETDHTVNCYPCRKTGILLNAPEEYQWTALKKARQQPEMILPRIRDAGLLGRGGGGFPAAAKWETTRNAVSDVKYVVCNADEGEPGTGKDRVLMERNPDAILEGMAVCAAAVGAKQGFIYLRGEYADLKAPLEKAIAEAPLEDFRIKVFQGQGAYICGEETALLNSLESRRGEPRLKPPYPGVAGLYGKPTVVNNAETFACVPFIINCGAGAFRDHGTEDYPGSKLYTVFGAVKDPGVYELRGGAAIGELLAAAGGETKPLQAILTGGGSGSLLTPDCLNLPMTPKACAENGASFGTASLRFIGEDENLVSVVRELIQFYAKESCGTCVPCRVGLKQLGKLLEKAETGNVWPEDLVQLQTLAEQIRATARCGLGQAAVTPLLTLLKNFPEVLK